MLLSRNSGCKGMLFLLIVKGFLDKNICLLLDKVGEKNSFYPLYD